MNEADDDRRCELSVARRGKVSETRRAAGFQGRAVFVGDMQQKRMVEHWRKAEDRVK